MANIKSAKKRISVIETKTARNSRVEERLKGILKDFEKAEAEGNVKVCEEKFALAEKKLNQAAAKKVITKNAASRKVGRLAKRLNALKANK